MNIIERLLGNALMQRAQAEGERLAGAGGGPDSLPLPLRAAIGTINPLGVPLRLKAVLDQDTAAARTLSGALDMGVGGYLGAVADVQHRLDPAMPGREAIPQKYQRAAQAYGATDSDVFDRLYAANESAARGNEFGQGLQNAITDPANLLGPAAKLARAAQLAELAKLLNFADEAQNVPVQLAGKGIAAGDRVLLGGAGARGLENTAQAVRLLKQRLLLRQVADAVIPAPPLTIPEPLVQGPLRGRQRGLSETVLPETPYTPGNLPKKGPGAGPGLTPEGEALDTVQGPLRRGQGRLDPTILPETPYRPGNVPRPDLLPGIGRNGGQGIGPLQPAFAPLTPPPGTAQLGLPAENPALLADNRAWAGLDHDQRQVLGLLTDEVRNGNDKAVQQLRYTAEGLGVPTDRIQRVLDAAYQALDAEHTAARLARIQESPYFSVFKYFNPQTGDLIKRNPLTGAALKPAMVRINGVLRNANAEIWDWPKAGYDTVADAALATRGGHDANTVDTSSFWSEARDAFREYRALRKPAPQAALPEVAPLLPGAETAALTPPTPTSPLNASTGTLDDLRALLNGPWSTSQYVPEANGIAKRLGVPVDQAQQWVDALIADGTLTRTPLGDLAFAPRTGKVGQDFPVVDPRLTAAMQDVNPLDVPAGALTAADEAAARGGGLTDYHPPFMPRTIDTAAQAAVPDLPVADLATLTPQEVDTLTALAYDGVPQAVANAVKAHPDPVERAAHALDKIQGDTAKVQWLGRNAPDLAQKVAQGVDTAALPDVVPPTASKPLTAAQANADLFGDEPVQPRTGKGVLPKGGDIAAGGGGMGLLPYPGGLTGPIGRAILPTAGAGAGAGIGYLTGDNPEDARANALKGAAIGGAIGGAAEYAPDLAAAAGRIVAPGSTWRSLGDAAARNARTEQSAANALSLTRPPVPVGLRDWFSLWKRQVVETPRNWLQDESWGRIVMRLLQPGATPELGALRKDAARYLTGTNDWDKLPVATRGLLTDLGQTNYVPQLGESLSQDLRHGKQLSAVQQATGGAALSLLNPVGAATSVLGVGAAGVTGAARPALSAVFRTINDFQHSTFRLAAFNDELTNLVGGGAEDFLARLSRQGVNVSSLPTSGAFSPAQVGALAGATAERQWAAITKRAVTLAEERVKFLFGDYAQKNLPERLLGGAIPFMSWVTRAYPVAVRMALDHPVLALAVFQYFRATSQGAGKDGRPGYTTGMVPIPTKTPFVGPVLAALVPGNKGVVYVDPVGAFSPVGADLFFGNGEDATDPNKTWYQRATATLSRLGLPGPNPLVQAGAYVTGLDYKTPGALSRTAGLEQGLALLPGNPQLPNVGANLLAGARSKVSPAIGPALGGKSDPYAAAYDPISRRYGELVYERTGHTLQDPVNAAYLIAMTDPENPLLQQARRDVLLSGAAKNAVSLVNPTQLVTQGQTPKDYRAAQNTMPFSDERIATAVPALAAAMQDANAHHRVNQPVTGIYQGTKPYQREDLLQAQWADQPDVQFVRRVLPQSYALQKKTQALELWEYDNRALKRSNPVEYQRQYQKKVKELGLD